MISISISERFAKVGDKTSAKKAYPKAQAKKTIGINEFASHIASHGNVYSRADLVSIITMEVDCIRELLLEGYRINLGELGDFYLSVTSKGAESIEKYNSANDIEGIKVRWSPGKQFKNLLEDASFEIVPTRAATALLLKNIREGKTNVDLNELKKNGSTTGGSSAGTGSGSGSNTGSNTGSGSGTGGSTPGGDNGGDGGEDLNI